MSDYTDKKKLDNATVAYYAMDEPVMTDDEYDKLFEKIYGDTTSPYELYQSLFVDDGRKRKLGKPMLSLSKAKKAETVQRWFDKLDDAEVVLSPKYDGLACLIEIEDGEIISAVTRGDGSVGDDVTFAVQHITDGRPETDGLHQVEVCMSAENMEEINKTRPEDKQYAHPRNAAAGILRLSSNTVKEYAPYLSIHKHFDANAFGVNRIVGKDEDIADVMDEYRSNIVDAMDESGRTIMLDGIVLFARDDDGVPMTSMGTDGAHPYWSIAWKFPDRGQIANVVDIHWQLNRVKHTPVATFYPKVVFDGVLVSKASLHNEDKIAELGVMIGDQVEIIRSGEVIPYIVKVVKHGDERTPAPEKPDVEAPLNMNVRHFLNTLDIRGAGPSVADDLAEKIDSETDDTVYRPVSILRVLNDMRVSAPDSFRDAVDSFADGRARKFTDEFNNRVESADMVTWFATMGIPGIGRRMSAQLFSELDGAKNAIEFLKSDEERVIESFGPERIRILRENIGDIEEFVNLVLEVTENTPEWYESAPKATSSAGTAVITGKIDGVSRNQVAAILEDHGWELASSVSSKTDILFNASGKESTKTKSAAKKGVNVVSVSSEDDIVNAITG